MLEIQIFSSFFGKNSNWVKYRNSPFLPFIYFSICVRASSMMTAGNGLALELWVVSYLLWGSSWENIYTCHSRAILQRGLPSGLAPFAKAVLAVDADYRSLRKDAFPVSHFSEKSYLRACLIIFTISFSKYESYKSSLNHLENKTIKNINTTTHKSTIIIYVCFYA